jgi:peptidoglycan/xylan/chitin deacetylase (PgdA/CDA1 family)
VFPLTIHPDVSGRPQVILMLERFIEYVRGHEGARWVTYGQIADDYLERVPPPSAR